jgi:hypothetical protein
MSGIFSQQGGNMEIKVNLPANLRHGAKFKGVFDIEVKDKLGNLISKGRAENIIPDAALDNILNVYFHATTQITAWYCGIFEDNVTPDGDTTYAVPVFTEWEAYDEGTRPAFTEAAADEQSITNSANKAVFTANATKTLYGAFLAGGGTDANTKGDVAGGGIIPCAGIFMDALGENPAPQPVVSGNVVNLTYTITAADAG